MWLGRERNCNSKPFGIRWPKEPVKALGIFFSYDVNAHETCNFVTKLEPLTRQLHWWKARDLSLVGIVLLIKSIGLSKFIFAATVLHVPEKVVQNVNTLLFHFLWNCRCDKVKRSIVVQDYEKGGLRMAELDMCIRSSKIKWIQKYLNCNTDATWKTTFNYMCKKGNLNLFIRSNFDMNELPKEIPLYYRDSFTCWKQVKNETVANKQDLNSQFLWYNINIKLHDKTVYCERLFTCGLWNINDLYANGRLIPFNVWLTRGAHVGDYLTWRGLVDAIPVPWKNMVRNEGNVTHTIETCSIVYEDKVITIYSATEKELKDFYKHRKLKELKENDCKAKFKYNSIFNIYEEDIWKNIYGMPFSILIENKIIDMQYKILHRTIGTNKLLFKMGKVASPNCEFCHMYPEAIEHLFFNCVIVKKFWFRVFEKLNIFQNVEINPTCKDVILYVDTGNINQDIVVNIICLYGKKYVYICKLEKEIPTVEMYAKYMMAKLTVLCNTTCNYGNEYKMVYDFIKTV